MNKADAVHAICTAAVVLPVVVQVAIVVEVVVPMVYGRGSSLPYRTIPYHTIPYHTIVPVWYGW